MHSTEFHAFFKSVKLPKELYKYLYPTFLKNVKSNANKSFSLLKMDPIIFSFFCAIVKIFKDLTLWCDFKDF